MKLEDYKRVRLANLPTPLEFLPRLSAHFGGPMIYVKRDDLTGLAMGGNKARKLEFLVADAIAQGCDTLVTTGGPQSNHARQTAAAAAKLGLECHLVLPRIVPRTDAEYENSGNVLLDRLLGAQCEFPPAEAYNPAVLDEAVRALESQGKKPYRIPVGGSTALGALGYVNAVRELLEQARAQKVAIDAIAVATGSSGTHGGIVAGLIDAGHAATIHGFAVNSTAAEKRQLVQTRAAGALELLGNAASGVEDRVQVDDRFVGDGYGLPTEAMIEAVQLVARLEGLLLDPVYTGKAMAGLIAAIRAGKFSAGDAVVFWHTGGTPALFAYRSTFT